MRQTRASATILAIIHTDAETRLVSGARGALRRLGVARLTSRLLHVRIDLIGKRLMFLGPRPLQVGLAAFASASSRSRSARAACSSASNLADSADRSRTSASSR